MANRTLLEDVTKIVAEAIDAKGTENGTTTNLSLPVETLAKISDRLFFGSPLDPYSSGLKINSFRGGGIEISYNKYSGDFIDKPKVGTFNYNPIEIAKEMTKWNKPKVKIEDMTAFDIAKGIPNVLAERIARNGSQFLIQSYQDGFTKIAAKAKELGGLDLTDAKKTFEDLVKKATKFLQSIRTKGAEFMYTREDVVITLAPEIMDQLSFAGLIGNLAEQSFAAGQYQIGLIGGYTVVSGDIFLPPNVEGVIGTNDSHFHSAQTVAANIDRIGISNDLGSYLEMADVNYTTERAKTNELIGKFTKGATASATKSTGSTTKP